MKQSLRSIVMGGKSKVQNSEKEPFFWWIRATVCKKKGRKEERKDYIYTSIHEYIYVSVEYKER